MALKIFHCRSGLTLESGYHFATYDLGYHTYGQLNEQADNVVWVFHALTANSDAEVWWSGLVGKGKLFDPDKYFIVCVNMPGSCYGSIGPLNTAPGTDQVFYHDFPFFTTRDMVRAYQRLRDFLGIRKIHIGIGGSMGGQQLLEWAIEEPPLFEYVIPLATNAFHSAWAKAFNSSQRWCIEADPTWQQGTEHAGIEGMKIARSIALLSYRNYETYARYQAEDNNEKLDDYKSESYQKYQGEKLAQRFNAFSYYKLLQSMDAHNLGRARGGVVNALRRIIAKTLVIGIETDILFPIAEQQFLAFNIAGAQFGLISSLYGHDGFLLAADDIAALIVPFINGNDNNNNASSVAAQSSEELTNDSLS